RADDSRQARVSFYTQSAVRLKAARDALERLVRERDAHAPPAREGRARLPLAYDFGRTVWRVQRLVAASERARQRLKQSLRVGRARRLLLDGRGRLKNLRRERSVVEVDADADDDRAPPCALDRLREYAAQLPTRSEQIIRPLDVRLKTARLNNRVRRGERRRQCDERPRARLQTRSQHDTEVKPRVLRRHPRATLPPAPRRLLSCDHAQTF